jgi:starvation-inducible DNA-binding protein
MSKASNGPAEATKFDTRLDLSQETRQEMIGLLNQELADIFDLYSQTKQAHWNVKGAQFFQLHELFDEIAEELLEVADVIAERATALGGEARGTVHMAAAASRLAEFPEGVFEGLEVLSALADRFVDLAASAREAIDAAEEAGDMDTSDLFIEVSRGLDKRLWFLEAHLQA